MESLKEKLRHAGLKATKSRLDVLRALQELGGHRSADDIRRLLAEQGEEPPRGSIFKVVGDLCRAHILMVTDAGPGRTLYEYADEWHHHFVCRLCGTILDVPCWEGRKPCLAPEAGIPAVIEEAQIIFRGVCHPCLESPPPNSECLP
jgi:Fur family ferric uptake transcriptional regulator